MGLAGFIDDVLHLPNELLALFYEVFGLSQKLARLFNLFLCLFGGIGHDPSIDKFTISAISQTLPVTPDSIAGVHRSVL